jgi:Fic family protein
MLHRLGVIQNVAIPISAGLLKNTKQYFEALESYRSADLDSIVTIVAEASLSAVQQSRKVASAFEVLQATWLERIDVRSDATALKLINHLFKQPLITSQQVVQQLNVTPRSANFAIEKLVELGILEQLNSGARNRIWVAEEIIQSLDSFASGLRR